MEDSPQDLVCKTEQKQEPGSVAISQLEPILSAECEPLATVAGCVNVISGRFFQMEKDLSSDAIEPLHLIRFLRSFWSLRCLDDHLFFGLF
jgi:hypothetical protein